MNIYFHKQADGAKSLYIDGNLQFDSRDEAIYHESLALPAMCMAPASQSVLICGGGDGLALREVLRFPGVEHVTLIDCSSEVIDIARTELKELNASSFDDPRVQLVIADALAYPFQECAYDVIICDFTFPTTKESALGFTVEWYATLKCALKCGGMIAINAVSPQNTASAFACLISTVRAAGLNALPYRVCIPSFRDHGFGAWGFILASNSKLTISQLQRIQSPVLTQQVDLPSLVRGAHFSLKQRHAFKIAPVNSIQSTVLQRLLLDPDITGPITNQETPPDYPNLLKHLEVSHPYHSRSMIETLAEHVAGSLQSIDLNKLIAELKKRAKSLPTRILEELECLQAYLARTVLDLELWGKWAARLFATLLIVMTIANSISPDPAFAKGHAGLGHSSFSRGFAEHETFGGGTPSAVRAPMTGPGFRSGYGSGPVDIYGYHYAPRIYIYDDFSYGTGYGGGYRSGNRGGGGHVPVGSQPQHKPLFVLDDDLIAMDNGDFVVTLSESAFLVVSDGKVNLVEAKTGRPLSPVYAEPKLFDEIRNEVAAQGQDLDHEVRTRRDWLSWAGWTGDIFGSVREDNREYLNLQDLKRRLGGSIKKLGASKESRSLTLEEGAVELFVGCHILSDNRMTLVGPGGVTQTIDGKTIVGAGGQTHPLSPELRAAIISIVKKMIVETQQDKASDQNDMLQLKSEETSTQMDLSEYQNIQSQNSYDPTYEVDYGTDSIPVGQAIQLTQQDLITIQRDQQLLDISIQKADEHLARFRATLQAWGE